jgi:nucleoid-associated protein YgaU
MPQVQDTRPQPAKAKIAKIDDENTAVVCHFNPNQVTVTRLLDWNEDTNIAGDVAKVTFAGGKADDLTMDFWFDTTDVGTDVRNAYSTLFTFATIDTATKDGVTGAGEPPTCRFMWGTFLSFDAVITAIKETFVMFKRDGTPVRAKVAVTFKQIASMTTPQNPTTRTETKKVWVVHEGETLDWIAYREYGNPGHWRHIAEANNLDNPLQLRPGQVLKLVPLP